MFQIFNGTTRGFGQTPVLETYLKMGVNFRQHLHHFKGCDLHVFLCIVLHANDKGWSNPTLSQIKRETGYETATISASLTRLCSTAINGSRLLFAMQERTKGKFKNNTYLIFPTEDEIAKHGEVERKPREAKTPNTEKPNTVPSNTENTTDGINHSSDKPSKENNTSDLVLKGDIDQVDNPIPPLQTDADHIDDHVKMVKPEPRKELLYEPKAQPSKPESNAPPSSEQPPVDAGPMIDALAAACMKFVKLIKHYDELTKTADSLIMLGFTADDVTQWRARCWPDHWKTKKGQPVPTLDDVLDNIGQVRTLPAAQVSTNPHEEAAAMYDDRPNPYAKPDVLPPRNIEYLEEYDPRFDKWNSAKESIATTNPKIDGWLRKFRPIGIDAEGAIVIEVATDETKAKVEPSRTLLLATMNIKPRGNHKPDVALVCVVVGDEQYRTDSEVTR